MPPRRRAAAETAETPGPKTFADIKALMDFMPETVHVIDTGIKGSDPSSYGNATETAAAAWEHTASLPSMFRGLPRRTDISLRKEHSRSDRMRAAMVDAALNRPRTW